MGKPGRYYLTDADIQAIGWAVNQPLLIDTLSDIETVVELGPGSFDAITRKTLPFLLSCKSLRQYVAVDAAFEQAQNASQNVAGFLNVEAQAVQANFMASDFRKSWSGKSAIVMWGSSLGNIEGSANEDASVRLASILENFRKGMDKDDLLLVCYDTERDGQKIIESYSELSLRAQILSTLYRLKRDGIVTGNFDPRIWRHEPVWFAEVGQCAHTVYPLFDQQVNIAGMTIKIPAWRRFITNNSYKFSPPTVRRTATKAGIEPLFCIQNGPIALFAGRA